MNKTMFYMQLTSDVTIGERFVKKYHRICAVLLTFILTAGLLAGCAKEEQAGITGARVITRRSWHIWWTALTVHRTRLK